MKEECMKKIKNMDVEWSYTGNDGPEHWHMLCDWFAEGAKFAYQSPIALEKESAETINSQITFHYKKEEFTEKEFKNTFHFVPPNTESYVMFENVAYHLTDIHFHMPSEHLLSGNQYPLEFHLVHMNDAGENLVVGCLFNITEEEN
ncbi:carbonic anhydrase family protein, partial [Enterococcus faecalis]